MAVNSFLNVAGWGASYGMSLYGAGLSVGAVGKMAASGFNAAWNGIRTMNDSTDGTSTEKPAKVARSTLQQLGHELKKEGKQLARGLGYCLAGLATRQVVARTFSETPPDIIVKGMENLGWQHINSPVIQRIVEAFNKYSPFPMTLM